MFGYIRPYPGELKVREFERFKACYCGLCRALSEKYGYSASFVLNYDLVFLAMLLWDSDSEPVIGRKRCAVSMCRKKPYCLRTPALDAAAGISVILAWQKLRDEIADEGFIKTLPHRFALIALRKAYKKASRELAGFDAAVTARLRELGELEAQHCESLDATADKFARILSAVPIDSSSESNRRALSELLYHTGRWIYLLDAFDDYEKDASAGRYNPAVLRYPPLDGEIPPEGAERMKTTLIHSANLVSAAFELLPGNAWSETVRNIIYLGMPEVCRRVFDGTWHVLRRDDALK